MSERHVHTVWCDDIRMEIGNKPSFMGVYTGGIVVASLPFQLEKLATYSWVTTPVDRPFKSLSARMIRDDGTPLLDLASLEYQSPANVREGSTRRVAMLAVSLASVALPEGIKWLQMLFQTESEQLEGPKLHIQLNPDLPTRLADAGRTFEPN